MRAPVRSTGAIMQRPSPNPWLARRSTRVFSEVGEGERRAFGASKEAPPGEVERESRSGSGRGLASVAEQCSDDAFDGG